MFSAHWSKVLLAALVGAVGLSTSAATASGQTQVTQNVVVAEAPARPGTVPAAGLFTLERDGTAVDTLPVQQTYQVARQGATLSDRVQIDVGYFAIGANTVLRYNGPSGGAGEIDFEEDLGIDKDATTFWLDATWRAGRRHQFKFNYTKLDRDRAGFTLQRDFTWGGENYSAGLEATSTTGTEILGGYYRFAVYRNERFEVGPTVGVGYLWLDAGIRAEGTIAGPGGSQSQSIDEEASVGSVTAAIGGYTKMWLARRLALQADYLYIKVTPDDSEASVTDWRVGVNYYFVPHVGVGAQYKHYTYSYDRGIFERELGGEITYEGLQVFASFLF